MKRDIKKKIISVILCFTMVISMFMDANALVYANGSGTDEDLITGEAIPGSVSDKDSGESGQSMVGGSENTQTLPAATDGGQNVPESPKSQDMGSADGSDSTETDESDIPYAGAMMTEESLAHELTGVKWTNKEGKTTDVEAVDHKYSLEETEASDIHSLQLTYKIACSLQDGTRVHAGDHYIMSLPEQLKAASDATGEVLDNKDTAEEKAVAVYLIENGKVKVTFNDAAEGFDTSLEAVLTLEVTVTDDAWSTEETTEIKCTAVPTDAAVSIILPKRQLTETETSKTETSKTETSKTETSKTETPKMDTDTDSSDTDSSDTGSSDTALSDEASLDTASSDTAPLDANSSNAVLGEIIKNKLGGFYSLRAQAKTAADWTNDRSELELFAGTFSYVDTDNNTHYVPSTTDEDGKTVFDFSSVPFSTIDNLGMNLGFMVMKGSGERQIKVGDTFRYTLPDLFKVNNNLNPQSIYAPDGQVIATFIIENNTFVVTFADAVDPELGNESILGEVECEFELNESKLGENGTNPVEWQIQTEGTTYVFGAPGNPHTLKGIEKSGEFAASEDDSRIAWTIKVGTDPASAGVALAGVTITDTFTAGEMEYLKAYMGDTSGQEIDFTKVSDGNYTYTFPADSKAVAPQTITVVTRPSSATLKKAGESLEDVKVSNHVEMSTEPNATTKVDEPKGANGQATIPHPSITKQGTQIGADTIHYEISVNEDKSGRILKAVVTDQLMADENGNQSKLANNKVIINNKEYTALTTAPTRTQTSTYVTYIDNTIKIYFLGSDNPLADAYKIEFDAKIDIASVSENTELNFPNAATITGEFPWGGTGPGPGIDWKMPSIGTDFQVAHVEKETTAVDTATGIIDWSIKPSTRTNNFTDWTITDVIGASCVDKNGNYVVGTYTSKDGEDKVTHQIDQTYVSGSVKVWDIIEGNKNDITSACTINTNDISVTDAAGNSIATQELVITPDAAHLSHINNIEVTLQTKAVNFYYENSVDHIYNNAVHLNVVKQTESVEPFTFDAYDDANRSFKNDFLAKTSDYMVEDDPTDHTSTGYVHYQIEVNGNYMTTTGLSVTDDLTKLTATAKDSVGKSIAIPASSWLLQTAGDKGIKVTKYTAADAEGVDDTANFASAIAAWNTSKKIEANFPAGASRYVIDLYLTLSQDELLKLQQECSGNYTIHLSNEAQAGCDEFNDDRSITVTCERDDDAPDVGNKLVDKSAVEQEDNPGTLDYRININPNGVKLEGAKMTDTPDSSIDIDLNSVELHYAVHTAGGAIDNKNIGTAVASGWTKNLAVVGGKPALQVSLPDGTASYVLTYQAQVISAVPSGAVSNEVVLTSTNGPTDSSKYEAKVSSNSWGWLEKKAIYKFVKADEFGGKATPLEGVVFNLYSDVECKNLKRTAISNSQGIVSFYGLDFDQTYYYKEDAAPKEYKLLEGDAETGSFSIIEANGNNVTRSEAVLNNRLTYDKAVQIEKTFDMTGYEAGQSYPQSTFKLYMYPNGFNSGVKVPIKVTGSNGSYNYAASDSADAKEDLVNALPTSSSNDIASGQISIIGLPWGCYGIEEVTPGSGFAAYEGMKYFSIDLPDAEGETALTANYTPTNTSKDIGAEKTISNEQTQLTIHKTADTGHSLAGAVLSVYGTDDQGTKSTIAVNPITGAAITTTVPVGEDNEFIWDIKGIPAGTYYLCEDTAPTDQVLSKFADIKFSINVYGKITILSGISGTSLSGTTITVKDETAEATLKKLDQFGQAATNAQIDLEVYDPAEKDWTKTGDTWIVGTGDDANTSGQKTFTGLDRGVTYRFRETQVPAGYLNVTAATENTIQFHIDEYGNVVTSGTETYVLNNVTDAPTAYANVFDGGNTFTMRNERIMGQAQFTKVSVNQDEGNKKSLSGAVFDLYKVGAGEAGADLLIAKGMTSAANGLVSTLSEKDAVTNAETKLKLNQGLTVGNYYFKETKTSSDFILPEGDNAKVSFEVKSDGSDRYTWRTVGSNSADHVITASGPAAANKPNVVLVTLKKTDAASTDGNIILVTGAAYRLTGKDINGNSISKDAITRAANSQISYSDSQGNSYTYTTKDDGEAVFTDIPRSDENGYTIREITPAPGYTLNSSTWNTGVVSNNTNNTTRIIHLNDLDGAAAVTDTKTNLTINKADDKDAALKGATFTVTPASGKTFANGSSEPISILSGEATDTLSGKLVAGVSYTITETKEPDGAATLKPFTVTCNANGTFTLNKGGNAANDLTLTHDAATGNNTIKAVNHLSITGTKTWADDSNAYGTRPTADAFKSSLGLYIDYTEAGKADEKVTDAVFTWNSTAGNTWTYTISGISPAPEGASYVVKETVPANYTETSSGTVSVQADGAANANKDLVAGELTNTLRKTKLDVQKTWVGPLENNALPAGYLPDSVKVQVQRTINKEGSSTWNTVQKNNAALILEVSGSTDPAWKVTVSDLPATDAEGHPYYYRAVETELIYDSTSYTRDKAENVDTNTIGAFSISETPAWNSVQEGASFESSTSITNTLVTNGMEASKTWTDADDQDGVRPTSVTFYLLKDKVKLTGYDKTVNADSSWKAKWTNLPSKQIDGTDIEYSVEEAEVESYTTGYEGNEANGYTVTNTHTPALVNKTVTKNWSDGSNKDLTRPASLKVTLYGTWTDDEKTAHKEKAGEQTIMAPANSSNAWTYEFKNLPKYKAGQVGKEITYSVEEEAVPGYTLQAVGDDLLNMTNTADTMSISVKKTWNDAGNTNRPDTTLWLQQSIDGGKTWTNRGEAKTLAKQGDETISYPDLPVMYQAATNYQYRVVEKTGTNYVPVLDGTVEVNSETNVITATSDFITAAKDDEEQIDITNNITQTQIAKKDTNGDYLSGAHFKLEGTLTDGSTSYEWTSGNTAETFVGKLKVDTEYTLTETSPADGYEITSFNENFNYPNAAGDGKSLTLKEDKTGKLFYKLAEGNATEWAQMTDNLALIKDEQTNIQIQKVDTADEPLEGTSFELSGTFVTGIQGPLTWTSDENAESITGKLIVGNVYTLTETNPSPGYQMAGTVKIKYITDEGWKMSTDDGASWDSISGDLLKIENENNSFTLKKVDEDNTPLEDSSFTIKGKFTDTPSDSESSTKELLGTGKSSETLTGKLISDQEYEIKETTPTDGYTVMKPFTVTMGKDGNISLVGEGRADVNISSNIVTAKNTQTDISIKKVDDSDPAQQIGGAKLKLEGTFADDTNEKSWESKADESYNLKGLVIVGETYTLTETERMTGYLDFPGAVTFKVTDEGTMEITANPNGKDETAAASLSDDEKELAVRNVKALGIVTLQKIDADTQLPINDVIFALYDNEDNLIKDGLATGNSYEASDWSATDATDGKLTIAGLDLGSYYLQEIAAEGYQVSSEKHNFTIDNDNGALDPSVDLVTIENKPTELSFDKTELYVETCSDPTLGDDVLSPALERPLAGAEFTAYSDKECSTLVTKETSNLNGRVTFKGLAAGTYWIKETSIPDGHDQSAKDDVYEAHFASNGTLESFGIIDAVTDIAAPGITTKITNDVLRTDIVLNKVSETDPNKKLPDSTYGLFVDDTQTVQGQRSFAVARMTELSKVAFTSGLKLIAKAKTDENGMLRFNGILVGRTYVIQELEAPDGSLVSKNPITLKYEVDEDGVPQIKLTDDGSGTAVVDPETGEVVWLEPPVQVSFDKKDEDGKLLAGARLQVVDTNGNIVAGPWTSSAESGNVVEGVLTGGETYKLQELQAPEGYDKAADVEFVVDDTPAAHGENRIQHVTMVDPKTVIPTSQTTSTSSQQNTSGTQTTSTGAKTSDAMGDTVPMMVMVMLAAAFAGTMAVKRMRRQHRR